MLAPLLIPRAFASGTLLCEGEEADRMWVIRKDSPSVRLEPTSRGDSRRVASMGAGTTVGEIRSRQAVGVGGVRRDVECYELSRAAFEAIRCSLASITPFSARELVQRIRVLNDDLRLLNG